MKKLLSILMVVAMLLALFAGCAGNTAAETPAAPATPDTPAAPEEPAAPAEKVELTVAMWGDEARAAAYTETLKPFCEANNCTVKIEIIPISDHFDKLAAQLAAGTAPDVFWLADAKEATFINGGWCENLRDVLEADASWNLADYYTDAIYSTDYDGDGDIYGVPFSFGAQALYYNKTIFEAAGIETPADCVANGTWTYEKMFDLASQIAKYDPTKIGIKLWCVGQTINGVQNFANILSAYGTEVVNADSTEFTLDSEAGIKVTQMVYDAMYTNGGHAKPGDDTAFVSGNIAMARETYSYMKTMAAGEIDFEWDIVPLPYGDKGTEGPLYTGYAYWCANATGKNIELSKELIKFVTNPENSLSWCKTFMCPRTSVMESDALLSLGEGYPEPSKIKAAYVDSVAERGLYTHRGTPDWTLLLTAVQQNYELIWAGEYTVEEGIAAMKDAVAPYLN